MTQTLVMGKWLNGGVMNKDKEPQGTVGGNTPSSFCSLCRVGLNEPSGSEGPGQEGSSEDPSHLPLEVRLLLSPLGKPEGNRMATLVACVLAHAGAGGRGGGQGFGRQPHCLLRAREVQVLTAVSWRLESYPLVMSGAEELLERDHMHGLHQQALPSLESSFKAPSFPTCICLMA